MAGLVISAAGEIPNSMDYRQLIAAKNPGQIDWLYKRYKVQRPYMIFFKTGLVSDF
jgi:hypothetical protein